MIDRARPPRLPPPRPYTFPDFETWELANRVTVIAAPDRRVPMVMLRLVIKAGADRDPEATPGLTALTAGLLDEGTTNSSSFELAAAAEQLGGYLATSADWDSTRVETALLSRDLATGIELVTDVVVNPVFPPPEVERLKLQTIAHLRRRQTQPAVVTRDCFNRALYGTGAYSRPLLGTEDAIASVERSRIVAHHRRLATPTASTLIVAGSFSHRELADCLEEALADWQGRRHDSPVGIETKHPEGQKVLLIDRPDAPQTELCLGHLGLPRSHPDYLALTVVNTLLGGKFTSRINLNLRERHACTYGAHSSMARRRQAGPFTIAAAIDNQSVALAVREVLGELTRLREEAVGDQELRETIDYLVGSFPYSCETLNGILHRLSDIVVFDLPADYYTTLPRVLGALTAEEILRVVRRHLHPDRMLIAVAGPAETLADQLAEIAPVELV